MTQLRTIVFLTSLLLVALPFCTAEAGEILEKPPRKPVPDARYVFYLHGQIVQDVGPRPTHPQYGLYDYPLILETLADHDLTVISQRRKQGTDRQKYAKTIVKQVDALLDRGVEPENITVLGFSAGGIITIFASSMMPGAEINFVIMASCSDWMVDAPDLTLNGRVLSVYELSDFAYSCKELAGRSPGPSGYQDVAINTGKEHGAFYLPDDAWVQPVVDWIKTANHPTNE
ncbi:MAG: alpha/beta hydrolase [Woeseiaceae bacterium]|nr:alpha/beta hydrolase [Woeseiaceae bacterium]